jgi:predicted HicB family RNase H-like nuclease
MAEVRHPKTFILRLPASLRVEADQLADHEGISLNHFIAQAIAEKLGRLEGFGEQTQGDEIH